ncbi:MAG: hypothetical protein ACI94Y_000324 [Maribacter sp.]|jgi:uncharacterized protein (DUF885 family)
MKKLLLALSVLFILSSCKKQDEVTNLNNSNFPLEIVKAESKKANLMFDEAFDNAVDRSPEWQSYLGIKKNYGEWDEISENAELDNKNFYQNSLQTIKDSIDYQKLDGKTKVSYKLFELFCQGNIDNYKWRNYGYPVNQMHGKHADIPAFLINIHDIETYEDATAYLSRLEGIQALVGQVIRKLQINEKNGVVPPKFVFDHVINDCKNVITGKPFPGTEESTLYADFKKKVEALDIKDAKKKTLLLGCEKRLMSNVRPAYENLIKFLQSQKRIATDDDGVWKFDKGEDFFKYRLKKITTTNMTSDEIHQLGLSEVDRIHGEMKDIMKQVNYEGSLQEFFAFMREDAQFYYEGTQKGKDAYMADAEALIDAMRLKLDEIFITKPKAKLVVKAVEPFREQSAGKAFYQDPAPDGSRPGTYYANTYDMKSMPNYQMEALAYHEAIPGHHMQLSIAQEMENMPKFRKFAGNFTAYIEGWGLYSEFLPKEIGFYEDPYSDFGRLAMELWRACRLVVDTGIHSKKWTRQESIDYYKSNTSNSESDCVKMVERHIVMPGQATAYKIGMIKILELREAAKKKLGDKFDIREFHEVVLTNGALPLDVLEDLVDEWVASK